MKLLRLSLPGILTAFVLLNLQPLAHATCVVPQSEMPSWTTSDDRVNNHIWQQVGTLYNGATYAPAAVSVPFQSRQLCFADRVAYQRAIEQVYWHHRIWPRNRGERPDPKPSLDGVMSQAAIEEKVQDYLRDSELLEEEWQKPITPERLQAEMERMAQHTKQPEVLRELFAALGNDPFVIAECLARPVLAERMITSSHVTQTKVRSTPKVAAAAIANYTLPKVSDGGSGCIDDSWTATSTTNAPDVREVHTAVWTGTEMIVWGGFGRHGAIPLTGGRYSPSTDSWTATSTTNAPESRYDHKAVWTGTEMIVWGGTNQNFVRLNTGGRYNPSTDSWTATSTTNSPAARSVHTAVWTGSEMIVWGGFDNSYTNTGGRYNPGTDSWAATSTSRVPFGRGYHTAVWTGSEMIVWGGWNGSSNLDTGGRYNPSTDSWTATITTNAPTARSKHTAVWTGSEMIVWGGFGLSFENTGGRYNPGTDSWTATSTTNAPAVREQHTAVWTGSEMIVWGGVGFGYFNTGGRYNPGTDSWMATSRTNAPTGREFHTAVWTGSEMIVWGGSVQTTGFFNTGGRYCAQGGSHTITLSGAGRKVGGINTVRLTWSGATSTDIDVYRNGTLVVTTLNDGSYLDSTGDTGRARYTSQVCEAGTQVCSNEVTATFSH